MQWNSLITLNQMPGFNMAADEYFFQLASTNKDFIPLVRFYTWDRPTISIGYNQKSAIFDIGKIKDHGYGFIRRVSGGRAVFHDKEITYSIIALANDPLLGDTIPQSYYKVSKAIVEGLTLLNIDCDIEKSMPKDYGRSKNFVLPCFASTARYEVVCGGKKLVGSAQKRTKTCFLQHGSLLLDYPENSILDFLKGESPLKNRCAMDERKNSITLNECGYEGRDLMTLISHLKLGFKKFLGVDFTEYILNSSDLAEIGKLEREKYLTNEWNLKI